MNEWLYSILGWKQRLENCVYFSTRDDQSCALVQKIMPIDGSCIYGDKWRDKFVPKCQRTKL